MSMLLFGAAIAGMVAMWAVLGRWSYRRDERRTHQRHIGNYMYVSCSLCNAHDWVLWSQGKCNCPRCRNIRQLEYETLDDEK